MATCSFNSIHERVRHALDASLINDTTIIQFITGPSMEYVKLTHLSRGSTSLVLSGRAYLLNCNLAFVQGYHRSY